MNNGWLWVLSVGIFVILILWNRFSIFLLKERVSMLENEIGIKSQKYSDKPKQKRQ